MYSKLGGKTGTLYVFQIDSDKKQVTVEAGLMVNELNELLTDHGLALSK